MGLHQRPPTQASVPCSLGSGNAQSAQCRFSAPAAICPRAAAQAPRAAPAGAKRASKINSGA
eukprot:884678-Alexandrium_andersonii.AAC.1